MPVDSRNFALVKEWARPEVVAFGRRLKTPTVGDMGEAMVRGFQEGEVKVAATL